MELLRLAAPLHDIGKIAVGDRILRKTGMLTDEERRLMEQHTDIGRDLLGDSTSELLELAAIIAWTHHERWDGSGYPRGLRGEEIPLGGRIVAVADVFDALSSDRPYRPRLSIDEARACDPRWRRSCVRPGHRRGLRAFLGFGGGRGMSITCVIADDHPPVLQFLSRYLSNNEFTITASAADGEEALRKIERDQADRRRARCADAAHVGARGSACAGRSAARRRV